jgi:hypothetical protein
MRIKTVQPTSNLMYAGGKVDYNILELANGAIQYQFDLDSGEGMVSVTRAYLLRTDNCMKLSWNGREIVRVWLSMANT